MLSDYHIVSVLMREFKAQQLLGCIRSKRDDDDQAVEPNLCFHTVPYNSNLFHNFGKHYELNVNTDSSRISSTDSSLFYVYMFSF